MDWRGGELQKSGERDLLDILLTRKHRAYRQRRVERFLCTEATDPNRARTRLPDRAQLGIYAPA